MVTREPAPEKAAPKGAPEDLVADRTRLLPIGMIAVFTACVVFAIVRLGVSIQSGHATPWWGNALGAVAVAALYLWFRGDPSPRVSVGVHATALIATVALIIPAAYGMASSKWWLSLVGFSVVLMGRRREATFWAVTTAILVPVVALVEPYVQVPNAVGEPAIERALAGLFFVVLLMGVTAAFRRVADRRARELSETAASLARANAVKSRFLAHMSHEVRTPLHGVIAMTDMAIEGDASPVVRQQIQMAQQSARVLLGLLNNVLDVARAESDALRIEQRPFALHAALAEVLRPIAAQARAAGLVFTAHAEPGVVEARIGDRVRFMQIALNLAGNALKFTREGSIEVRLGATGDRVTLVVADTGHGIPRERLDAIFLPFEQARVADARVQGGAGLGLAIVRELAEKMGGSVRVESAPGRGSTFVAEIRLPLDDTKPAQEGPEVLLTEASEAAARPPTGRAARPLSVLVCEDDAVNQVVLRAMLERLGHTVELVDDGARAWELLQTKRFDLMVTDVEMPGLDGVELTRRVRTREDGGRRMPIVGVTAHVGEEEQHRLLDAGMDAHLPKPFRLAELASTLAKVIPPSSSPAG
ncbi:MAG: ATP-binding protein [Polyangiaceae bacterium]|jgi:signal transduction histidine kinase/ActR/RegA family two-component response regulator